MSLNFNGNYIGGIPSGGGGTPYILPIASTTTLGGVKIDGTSITIDDGVISSTGGGSITVDSALSDSSENPVQNKVITSALKDFYYFPGDTAIGNFNGLIMIGIITTASKCLKTSFTLDKLLHPSIETITINHFQTVVRSKDGDYILSKRIDDITGWKKYDLISLINSSSFEKTTSSIINASFIFSTAFDNTIIANNTPVLFENYEYSITFS